MLNEALLLFLSIYLSLTFLLFLYSCSLCRCEASNGLDTVRSDAIVRVNLGSLGTLPRSFPPLQPGAFPGDGQVNINFS